MTDAMSEHRVIPTGNRATVAKHFRAVAQERKRDRLVSLFDAAAETVGLKPHTEDAGVIQIALSDCFSEDDWIQAAREAGVNPPSDEVRDMVICIYRERAKG